MCRLRCKSRATSSRDAPYVVRSARLAASRYARGDNRTTRAELRLAPALPGEAISGPLNPVLYVA
jgi:hypothetical protein